MDPHLGGQKGPIKLVLSALSVGLSGTFLGIGSLDFYENLHDVADLCKVVHVAMPDFSRKFLMPLK